MEPGLAKLVVLSDYLANDDACGLVRTLDGTLAERFPELLRHFCWCVCGDVAHSVLFLATESE